jgi:hypothetical protein
VDVVIVVRIARNIDQRSIDPLWRGGMSLLVLSELSPAMNRLDFTENEKEDDEKEDVEEDGLLLLRRLDESILLAEELDLWQRIEQSIQAAEEKQQINFIIAGSRIRKGDQDPWSDIEEHEEEDNHTDGTTKFQKRKKKRRRESTIGSLPDMNASSGSFHASNKVIDGSVQGLEYVQASKLLPRNCIWMNPEDTGSRPKITKSIVRNMADRFARQKMLPPVYYSGFRAELRSAHPDAWRLIVMGYRKTVQMFRQTMLQKELVIPSEASVDGPLPQSRSSTHPT